MKLFLQQVTGALPAGLATLRADARADGHLMLDTLVTEWASVANRFARPGETLLAAYDGDVLAGIGGLTQELAIPGALRMRRFYVRADYRRAGIGHALAIALLETITGGTTVTANAASGSEAFWEALGFTPDRRDGHSHILVIAR